MTDVSSAIESLQKSEDSHHRLIIGLLIVLIIIGIILYTICSPCKSGWTNCMLPNNPVDAVKMWKAAGVSDEEIGFLLGTYFPAGGQVPEKRPPPQVAGGLDLEYHGV
jgi:hypothetical protein